MEVTAITNMGHKLANTNLPIDQILPSVRDRAAPRRSAALSAVQQRDDFEPIDRRLALYCRVRAPFQALQSGLNINASYTQASFWITVLKAAKPARSGVAPYANQYNRAADWGPSGNDIRHRFTFGSVYELPFGPGKHWLSNGVAGMYRGCMDAGRGGDSAGGAADQHHDQHQQHQQLFHGGSRANVVGHAVLPSGQRSVNQWFNTAAFAQPAIYTFGNAARNDVRAPGIVDWICLWAATSACARG